MPLKLPPEGIIFAFDFETLPDTYIADIVSFAWFTGNGETAVSYEIEKLSDLDKQAIFNAFDKARGVIAHNVGFDIRVLRAWGYPINRLEGRIHDTMLMVAVEDTEQEKKLASVAGRVGMVKRDWDDARHNREEYLKYASDDSLICLKLFEHMRGVLSRLEMWAAYNLEIEMVWCLLEMYDYGISIDLQVLEELTNESDRLRKQFMTQLIDLAGYTLNLNSTRQLRELIYGHWKIDPNKALLTEKGDTSTGKEAIHEISTRLDIPENVKEFCRQLLEYKSYTKLASTFLGPNFKSHIHPDGKIRSDIGSVFTRTARLNSSNPNCYSDDTEILTEYGWKFFSELDNEIKVAQINPVTFEISMVVPARMSLKMDEGSHLIRFSARDFDLLVTPDHRMISYGTAMKLEIDHAEDWLKPRARGTFAVMNGFADSDNHNWGFIEVDKVTEVPYSGKVYCVSVPTGAVIVRRLGKPVICGNCQNIPARGNGASIRKMFVASEGNLLIVADQSQLEYRILAHFSNDPALMNPYINDPETDIHDIVSKLLGLPRWAGKNMNFASVYGQKESSLAKKSNISVSQARSFLAEYDRRFPGVRKYVSGAETFARANHYCIMPSGRRRSLGQYAGQGGSLERNGVNTPVQGCLDYETLVYIKESGPVQIGDLYDEYGSKKIFNILTRGGEYRKGIVTCSGTQELSRLRFSDGTSIVCTSDHPFLTLHPGMIFKWVEASKLRDVDYAIGFYPTQIESGNEISFPVATEFTGPNARRNRKFEFVVSQDAAWVMGMLTGDGSFGRWGMSCVFSHRDRDNAEKFAGIVSKWVGYNVPVTTRHKERTGKHNDLYNVYLKKRLVQQILGKCGMNYANGPEKTVPSVIFKSPARVVAAYLNGLFTSDGTVNQADGGVVLTTTSEELAYQVGNLLNTLGIDSSLIFRGDGAFNISIHRDRDKFIETVGFTGKWKNDRLRTARAPKRVAPPADLPVWFSENIVRASAGNTSASAKVIRSRTLKHAKAISKLTALRLFSDSDSPEYRFLAQGNYLKRLLGREDLGEGMTYDISMIDQSRPEYLANGTVVHNTAAEIMKVCMIAARKILPRECKMILQVHDELLFDCPEELVPECLPKVKEIMEQSYKLNVPLLVEPEASRNWKEAKGD